jgi:hypothetical protein
MTSHEHFYATGQSVQLLAMGWMFRVQFGMYPPSHLPNWFRRPFSMEITDATWSQRIISIQSQGPQCIHIYLHMPYINSQCGCFGSWVTLTLHTSLLLFYTKKQHYTVYSLLLDWFPWLTWDSHCKDLKQ